MKLNKIKPNKANPRVIKDDKFKKLVRSLQSFPEMMQKRPIVVDSDMTILGGNMRYKALVEIYGKSGEIPDEWVTTADGWTDEQKREFIIKDNASYGEWAVAELLDDWSRKELSEWGVDVPEWDEEDITETEETKEDDFDPDAEHYEPKVKRGEVWQLGEHRLMCGDSTKAEDFEKLMNGEKADIGFTSPPYNAGASEKLSGNTHTTTSKYKNSDDNLSNYDELLFKSTQNNIDFAKYAFINIQMLAGNKIVFCDFVEKFKNQLCDIAIWNKNTTAPAQARRVMNSQFEFIFIFNKDNPSRAVGTRDFRGDVSNVNNMSPQRKNEYSAIHAATFSVEFAGYYVGKFSNQGDIVLDSFGGTGTTIIACEQLNRQCRMMELDPHYCDVIIARWEKLTGKKAIRI